MIFTTILTTVLLLVIIIIDNGKSCEILVTILKSPKVTNWGDWGDMDKCSFGQFAIGMRLKTDKNMSSDNTGLNGIKFFCAKPGHPINGTNAVTSTLGTRGRWGTIYLCSGQKEVVTGFQMRSDKSRGTLFSSRDADDTAANNLRIFCNHNTRVGLEGDGTSWGVWTEAQHCPVGERVAGIRTQIESAQGPGDDTSLNNIQVECRAYSPCCYNQSSGHGHG